MNYEVVIFSIVILCCLHIIFRVDQRPKTMMTAVIITLYKIFFNKKRVFFVDSSLHGRGVSYV